MSLFISYCTLQRYFYNQSYLNFFFYISRPFFQEWELQIYPLLSPILVSWSYLSLVSKIGTRQNLHTSNHTHSIFYFQFKYEPWISHFFISFKIFISFSLYGNMDTKILMVFIFTCIMSIFYFMFYILKIFFLEITSICHN